MKFLLDMGLARSTATYLRTKGHDAVHLRDQRLQRLSDEQIIAKALSEGRTILTHEIESGALVSVNEQSIRVRKLPVGEAGD